MTRKQILKIAVIGGMFIVAGILVLGDLGKEKNTSSDQLKITTVVASVQTSGVSVLVSGSHASCDILSDWEQKRQRDLISVTPVFERLPDVTCEAIVPFEENVLVDVGDLKVGTYTIDVLGTTTSVTLNTPIMPFDFESFSDDSFDRFPIAVDAEIQKAELDTSLLAEFGTVEQLKARWATASVTIADRLTTMTVSCGNQCYKHAIIDLETGRLVRMFDSSFGLISEAGSLLLVVNDPVVIKASGTTDAVVAEAYVFNPDARTFEFIAQGDYLLGELHN